MTVHQLPPISSSVNYIPYNSNIDIAPLIPDEEEELRRQKKRKCFTCRCTCFTIIMIVITVFLLMMGLAVLIYFMAHEPTFKLLSITVQTPQQNNTILPVLMEIDCDNTNIVSADVSTALTIYLSDGVSYLGDGYMNKTHVIASGHTTLVFQVLFTVGPNFDALVEAVLDNGVAFPVVVDAVLTVELGALNLKGTLHEAFSIPPYQNFTSIDSTLS
jgi:hypothetical protein